MLLDLLEKWREDDGGELSMLPLDIIGAIVNGDENVAREAAHGRYCDAFAAGMEAGRIVDDIERQLRQSTPQGTFGPPPDRPQAEDDALPF